MNQDDIDKIREGFEDSFRRKMETLPLFYFLQWIKIFILSLFFMAFEE